MRSRRQLGIAAGAVAALTLLVGCGGGTKDDPSTAVSVDITPVGSTTVKPSITTTSGGSTTSGPAPVILSSGPVRAASAAFAAPGGAPSGALPYGLTVRDTASATVPADDAFAIALYYPRNASGPFPRLAAGDEAKLRAALAAAGFPDKDVAVSASSQFGPQTFIRVRVGVLDVVAGAKKVSDAIAESIGRAEQEGVQFALKDCPAVLAPIRAEAFKRVEARAKALSLAANVKLGAVVALSDAPAANLYGPPVADPCADGLDFGLKGYPTFLPADSPADVVLTADLSVTYLLADAPQIVKDDGVVVVGTGKAKAKADEAYVIIFAEINGPRGPIPIAQRDRKDILDKLAALGVKEADVEFVSNANGGPSLVSVETKDLANLAKFADDVSDAVEEVLGQSSNKGVTFTHSECELVRDEARKAAVLDARLRAKALSAAADLKIGDLRAVSEGTAVNPYGPPLVDACSEDLSQLAIYGYGGAALQPFNAAPEFEVQSTVAATFALTR